MTTSSPQHPVVIVGVDGSESSKHALRWAARLARIEDARIEVVGTWQYPYAYGWAALPVEYSPKDDIEKVLNDVVDEVFETGRPNGLHVSVLEGDPARVLIELSQDALVVVVGSRGRGGFAGLVLGSVSRKVAELSKCPVLIAHGVPSEGADS